MPVRTALASDRTSRFAVAPTRIALVALLAVLPAITVAAPAAAEQGWIRGGIRLNLRTQPGTQFRIIGVVETGDAVEVVGSAEGWTNIRLADGKTGWIEEGYLDSEPPPTVRVTQLEQEVSKLREQLQTSDAKVQTLTTAGEEIAGRDGAQRAEIDRLTLENAELLAKRRWPEWITGASVLVAGMLLGAVLHRNATRRPGTRIRL